MGAFAVTNAWPFRLVIVFSLLILTMPLLLACGSASDSSDSDDRSRRERERERDRERDRDRDRDRESEPRRSAGIAGVAGRLLDEPAEPAGSPAPAAPAAAPESPPPAVTDLAGLFATDGSAPTAVERRSGANGDPGIRRVGAYSGGRHSPGSLQR